MKLTPSAGDSLTWDRHYNKAVPVPLFLLFLCGLHALACPEQLAKYFAHVRARGLRIVPLHVRPGMDFAAGFTLIELLVVIAIVVVLAALLLPALAAAQSNARRIHCASNLHELGMALQMYVADNGSYPVAMTTNGLGNWQRALWPSSTDKVLYCPQIMPASEQFMLFFPSNTFIYPHYGYNASGAVRINPPPQNPGLGGNFVWSGLGTGNYVPATENCVRAPSQMIAIGDGYTFILPPLNLPDLSPADPLYTIFPYIEQPQGYPGVNRNHDGGANMLFVDDHVEFGLQTNWLSASSTVKCLWNADNQSHPSFQ